MLVWSASVCGKHFGFPVLSASDFPVPKLLRGMIVLMMSFISSLEWRGDCHGKDRCEQRPCCPDSSPQRATPRRRRQEGSGLKSVLGLHLARQQAVERKKKSAHGKVSLLLILGEEVLVQKGGAYG